MKSILVLLCAVTALTLNSFAAEKPLNVGDTAPVVSGVSDTGEVVNLGDVYKQNAYTLVYFYPKAKTAGCTAQGCSLRDAYEDLTKKGVAVIGVSTDDVKTQAEFKKEQNFPFTLIADTDRKVINAFQVGTVDVPVVGSFAHRQAYLIHDGKVVYADHKGTTKEQAKNILDFLASQKS